MPYRQPPEILVHRILSEPAYRLVAEPPPEQSIWAKIFDWIRRHFFNHAVPHMYFPARSFRVTAVVVTCVVGLVLLVLVVTLATIWISQLKRKRRSRAGEDAYIRETSNLRADARELFARGEALAAREQFAPAVSAIFHAATVLCDETGIVPLTPTLTAAEYSRRVRRTGGEAGVPFEALGKLATVATFSGTSVDRDAWLAARSAYTALHEHLPK